MVEQKETELCMMKKHCFALLACLLGGCTAFAGCTAQEPELTTVRLNEVVHSIFYAPQYVAMELGYFEDEGLNIITDVGQGADKSMTALLSGSADIALKERPMALSPLPSLLSGPATSCWAVRRIQTFNGVTWLVIA